MPTRLEISNFRSDVDASTSTNSISQNSGNVNPSGKRYLSPRCLILFTGGELSSPPPAAYLPPMQNSRRVSFGFFRKNFTVVDLFQDCDGCVECIKKTFRKLITNCMNRWQLLTKGLMVGLLPVIVYLKPPELSTRPSARHMSTLSGRVWRAVVRS